MISLGDPHRHIPVLHAGSPLDDARAVMILLHGRGATADSILALTHELTAPGVAFLAPQAAGYTWYPYSFLSPLDSNEPYLTSALNAISRVLEQVQQAGKPPDKTVLLGFSQGACLALEYAIRQARRYGGIVGFSGGLIGPEGTSWDYPGSLDGTPVFIGCSDVDPHVPLVRVKQSANVLRRHGGAVTERIYPNMAHTVNQDEIGFVNEMLAQLVRA